MRMIFVLQKIWNPKRNQLLIVRSFLPSNGHLRTKWTKHWGGFDLGPIPWGIVVTLWHRLRTLKETFFSNIPNFWLGQTNLAEVYWSIWVICTYFGTVSPLFMFSINQPSFLKVTQFYYVSRNQLHYTANLNFGLKGKKAKHCWA